MPAKDGSTCRAASFRTATLVRRQWPPEAFDFAFAPEATRGCVTVTIAPRNCAARSGCATFGCKVCDCLRPDDSKRTSETSAERGFPRKFLMSRYAWVTLVMRDELYACGALVLGQSLRRAGTQADLVCMVTDDIPADVTSALGEVWDHVVCVPRLEARRPVQQRRQVRFGAAYSPWLQSCLTKFCCLQMTRYSKVVFLDADMLCVAAALSPLVPSPSPSPPPSPSTRADEGEEHGVSHGGAEQSEAPVNTRLAGNLIRRKGEKEENESGGEEEEGEEEKEGEEKGKDEDWQRQMFCRDG